MEIQYTQPFDYRGIECIQEQSGAHKVQPVAQAEFWEISDHTQGCNTQAEFWEISDHTQGCNTQAEFWEISDHTQGRNTQAEFWEISDHTQGRIGRILGLSSNNGAPSGNPNAEIELAFRIAAVRLSIQGLKPFNPNS